MLIPIFIQVPETKYSSSYGSAYVAATGKALAIAMCSACLVGFLAMFAVFGSFKPYSYLFNTYKPFEQANELVPAQLAAEAYASGITELESRPWSWLGSSPNLKGTVAGTFHEFQAESSYHPPYNRYRVTFGPDGAKLWLHTIPQTESEAIITKLTLRTDISKAVKELAQDIKDAQFRKTGKLS